MDVKNKQPMPNIPGLRRELVRISKPQKPAPPRSRVIVPPRPVPRPPRVMPLNVSGRFKPSQIDLRSAKLPALPPATVETRHPMSMLHVFLWKWNQASFREVYTMQHVDACVRMLRPALEGIPHKIHLITDDRYMAPDGIDVHDLWTDHDDVANASGWHLPSCYRRLKLFDMATLESMGVKKGERAASLDLDVAVTGSLKNIVYRKERFVSWGVPGTYHPRVFNGSFWMFTAGDLQHIWDTFDPAESPRRAIKTGFLGSDQGWLSLNLARSGDAHGVRFPDIASYPREVRRQRALHRETRMVFFHGAQKPWHPNVQRESPWITRYWKG